jgi:hypothetical protein
MRSALLLLLLAAAPVGAQTGAGEAAAYPVDPTSIPRPALVAVRSAGVILVDGHLDEMDWARADSTSTDFIQVQPAPGFPASEPTVIRILYDDRNLYIGATLYESEPEKLIVPGLEQDYSTHDSDILGIALDTYHDRQNGFLWAINPAGAVWDAQAFDDSRNVNMAWEGIVDVRTSVGDDRWTVEMAIPFTTLRYTPARGEQTWGLAFSRRIRHLNEESNWAPTERQYKLYKFSLAGSLEGLTGLRKARNVSVKPYVLASRLSAGPERRVSTSGDVGLDVKWGVTPRLTVDVTANTDFSQVEVDQEQVNLTRFNLFFPEKRDFFLENDGTFGFQDVTIRNYRTGSSPRSFKLFHSRRIGLSPDRVPLPIAAGARLTGKVGGNLEVGFLNMQTRSTGSASGQDFVPGENFSVARMKALLGARASVGAMFVNRQETASSYGGYNRSYGVDGHVTLFDNLVVSAYAARTEEDEPAGESRDALMVQAAWRDPLWDVSILTKHVGDDFNPGLGFVDRTGVRRLFTTVGAHPQVNSRHVIEVNPFVDVDVYSSLGGVMESRAVTPTLSVLFRDGGVLQVEASDRYERLFDATSNAVGPVLGERGRFLRRHTPVRRCDDAVPAESTLLGRRGDPAQRSEARWARLHCGRLQRPCPLGSGRAHVPPWVRAVQRGHGRAHHQCALQPHPRAPLGSVPRLYRATVPGRFGIGARGRAGPHAEGDEAGGVLSRQPASLSRMWARPRPDPGRKLTRSTWGSSPKPSAGRTSALAPRASSTTGSTPKRRTA